MPVLDKTFCTPSCMRECLILRMYDPISLPAIGATDHNRMSTKPFGYCTGKNLLTFGLCFLCSSTPWNLPDILSRDCKMDRVFDGHRMDRFGRGDDL